MLRMRKQIKACFTFGCAIVVTFMVGFWIYKYDVEDRDIVVVDFLPIEEASGIDFPVASLCFKDPFIKERTVQA